MLELVTTTPSVRDCLKLYILFKHIFSCEPFIWIKLIGTQFISNGSNCYSRRNFTVLKLNPNLKNWLQLIFNTWHLLSYQLTILVLPLPAWRPVYELLAGGSCSYFGCFFNSTHSWMRRNLCTQFFGLFRVFSRKSLYVLLYFKLFFFNWEWVTWRIREYKMLAWKWCWMKSWSKL